MLYKTTASDSALVATVAARSRYMQQNPDIPTEKLLIYTTTQTHSLGKKTGVVLGLKVRVLGAASEDNFALRGCTLHQALEEDKGAGLHPFILSTICQQGNFNVPLTLVLQLELSGRPPPVPLIASMN